MDDTPQQKLNAQGDRGITTIKVKWSDPNNVPLTYSNIMMSQFTPNEFIITFGQVVPPNTLDMDEDEIQALESINGVTVARIVFSHGKMREFVATLQHNLEQLEALLEGVEDLEE